MEFRDGSIGTSAGEVYSGHVVERDLSQEGVDLQVEGSELLRRDPHQVSPSADKPS